MTILRPSCYGDSERIFRVCEASLLWVKTEDRTAGNERERDRVRYPSFQKRDAHALRFGSMNPISRVLGPWEHGERGETEQNANPE